MSCSFLSGELLKEVDMYKKIALGAEQATGGLLSCSERTTSLHLHCEVPRTEVSQAGVLLT